MNTDPIADMLSRIRNSVLVGKSTVSMPHSKVKEQILDVLKRTGFISDYKVSKATVGQSIDVVLHSDTETAKITNLERVSRPGLRVYKPKRDIPLVMNGRGIVVVSTSQGIMAGHEAKKANIGGEIICKVY